MSRKNKKVPKMKTKNAFVTAFIIVMSFIITNVSLSKSESEGIMGEKHGSNNISPAEELRTEMRKLWEDHIVWTRNVILNIVDGLPGTDQAVDRLLNNQVDIGNAIKPYYGNEAGEKLAGLLKPHITIAAEVVTAAKNGDKTALDDANRRWYVNAEEISVFLSSANPNWKVEEMKSMMNDHLKFTTDEAVARLQKDYAADIKAYEKVHEEILMMSDDLANGIIKQFPDKFKE
jgi:hypothetical protein